LASRLTPGLSISLSACSGEETGGHFINRPKRGSCLLSVEVRRILLRHEKQLAPAKIIAERAGNARKPPNSSRIVGVWEQAKIRAEAQVREKSPKDFINQLIVPPTRRVNRRFGEQRPCPRLHPAPLGERRASNYRRHSNRSLDGGLQHCSPALSAGLSPTARIHQC
jgi:hypothetical protein